ncbi:MAG: DUF2971 domain-containing protein [Chitinophagaceae bacterium]|nr:MAG: DUF2971 domain-containing protein [Chitinophagaceae bacterium]
MKLYKYQTVNKNSISCLINKFVWFSSPNDFNDPYDTPIIDNDFLRSINFNNEKIYCLSAKNDSFLMWSHYCASHRGFCIEFTDYTDQEISELKQKGIFPKDAPNDKLTTVRNAKPVQYKSTEAINKHVEGFPVNEEHFRKYFEDYKQRGKEQELIDLIHGSSFIKHLDWSYEEEYRIINISKNIVHPPGKITGVYFGVKMSSLDKRSVGMVLNPDLKGDCNLYQMYREKGTYTLRTREFNHQTDLEGVDIVY